MIPTTSFGFAGGAGSAERVARVDDRTTKRNRKAILYLCFIAPQITGPEIESEKSAIYKRGT
jgi:hypothetical protein